MKKKVFPHIFYFQQKNSHKNVEEHIIHVHEEIHCSDFYKTITRLKNVLTLVYTSGVAQTKNGQNFKS